MLSNYEILSNGVVRQIKVKPIKPIDYASMYDSYGELAMQMAYLRYGYIRGRLNSCTVDTFLDIGYGNGCFLKVVQQAGYLAYGYDLEGAIDPPQGVQRVKSYFDIPVDVTTFYDSLEHFQDINVIKDINTRFMVISVPNCDRPEDDEWFFNWKHRRPNEHLWHFNRQSLCNFMRDIGYLPIEMSSIEDVIRKNPNQRVSNIITGIFRKV